MSAQPKIYILTKGPFLGPFLFESLEFVLRKVFFASEQFLQNT